MHTQVCSSETSTDWTSSIGSLGLGRPESLLLDGGYDVRASGGRRPGSRGNAGTRPLDDELLRDLSAMGNLPKDVTSAWAESKRQPRRQNHPRVLPGM